MLKKLLLLTAHTEIFLFNDLDGMKDLKQAKLYATCSSIQESID
uniref:Uncharacterized protein n=1 Tax=Arundo donax TaxID=35708 RepID=A0A0A9BKZ4_ARUDO